MEHIKEIFEAIQATNSKIGKEQLLKEHLDDEIFKSTLRFLLDPFVTTGLSTKKINKRLKSKPTVELPNAKAAMNYLRNHNTGSDEIIANVQSFLSRQPDHLIDFYKGLFTKSIKLGCAANTVNKVFGKGFIPQFECMLAEKYFDYADKVEGKNFTLTLKLDGFRALAIKGKHGTQFFSRQGQRIAGLVEIEQELNKMTNHSFVLDGELLIADTSNLSSKEQYKATTKIVRRDGEKSGIAFRAFDYLNYNEFMNQDCTMPFTYRRSLLDTHFSEHKHTDVLPILYSGNDVSQINRWLDKVRSNEEEGLMLNLNDGLYEFKRTRNLLKVKVMDNCDLHIIGFEEGQGRLSGTLGRLNVEYKGNIVGVGSGFTDEQRKWFWENQDNLNGRVVSVNYFEESQDKDGRASLRFPVFKELREVGKAANF